MTEVRKAILSGNAGLAARKYMESKGVGHDVETSKDYPRLGIRDVFMNDPSEGGWVHIVRGRGMTTVCGRPVGGLRKARKHELGNMCVDCVYPVKERIAEYHRRCAEILDGV